MSLSRLFLLFLAYSFIGWCSEVVFCSIKERRFVNRGFLFGPLCPIYGFGGMMVMYLLKPWADTWIPLFFAAMFITTALEYVSSWALEVLFHTKWWDYSDVKVNLNGRVCLTGAVTFGVMGMLAAHFVHPFLEAFVLSFSDFTVRLCAGVLCTVFCADLYVTVKRLVGFNEHMAKLKEFAESLKERYAEESWFKEKASSLSEMFDAVRDRAKSGQTKFSESLMRKIESFSARQEKLTGFINRFPTMRSKSYSDGIENLRQRTKAQFAAKKAARKTGKNAE